MRVFIRKHLKTLLFFAIIGALGGYFVGLYLLDSYPAEIVEQIAAEGIDRNMLGAITAAQSVGYGIVLGALGIIIAEKLGLWKNERKIEPRPLLCALAVAAVSGGVIMLLDLAVFSNSSQAIADSYAVKPTLDFISAKTEKSPNGTLFGCCLGIFYF